MSANSQGTNAFATNATGGGVGIRTADPSASTNSWLMATPSNYQNWQSPDWIQSGLTQSTQPISNFPVTNYGRWNYANGATNGYGMGASPWPAPSSLFGGSGSAGNGMPTPGTPPAGGGSKAGAGTTPPGSVTPPPAGGGTKAGGGTPPPIGGGTPPSVGGGIQPPVGGGTPPQAGSLTTNGMGLSPHFNGGVPVGALANRMSQIQANQGQLQAAPFTPGVYNTPGQQALLAAMANLRPGGRPYPSGS